MAQLKKNPPIIFDYKHVKLCNATSMFTVNEPISKTGLSENNSEAWQ